jgi:hypothetical protein
MAGPLSSITRTGECDYVYSREDDSFALVSDPSKLRARLLEWHCGLAAGVEKFVPVTPNEGEDLAFMRSVVVQMRELVERACAVEAAHWNSQRKT